ncbi:MAG: glycosyltransferase family 4 protein, partial [Lentisphaeraceae bacterium]|nr:glycosyltransferase family 4 protein [Lentisphaeraceae bacterium]
VKLINVKTLKGKHTETIFYSLQAMVHASRRDFDVIHIHALATACLGWIPKFLFGKKVVISVHGLDWQRAKWGLAARLVLKFGEWASVNFSNLTVCVSKSLTTYYQMRYSSHKVTYIPNGCDLSDPQIKYCLFPQLPSKSYFLYLGRLVPEKGVHTLIESYLKIKTNKKLVIAGPDSDQKYARKLRALAAGNENIIFTGAVRDHKKTSLLANAFLFVLPSDIEGLPIALLEAASYAVCTAVSNIPACEEVIDNQQLPCGFSFTPGNVDELQSVLQLSDQSNELVKALGEKLQCQVQEEYNWDRISVESVMAYECVVRC